MARQKVRRGLKPRYRLYMHESPFGFSMPDGKGWGMGDYDSYGINTMNGDGFGHIGDTFSRLGPEGDGISEWPPSPVKASEDITTLEILALMG